MGLLQKHDRLLTIFIKKGYTRHININSNSLRHQKINRFGGEYPFLNYDHEEEARSGVSLVDNYTMCSYERLISLWSQVRYLDHTSIKGDLVECGTWKGGCCGMMALSHLKSGTPYRKIHLFDSFQGLPEPLQDVDGQRAVDYATGKKSGKCKPIGKCIGTLDENIELLQNKIKYPEELIEYHVGWFQNTLPIAKDTIHSIALLRLDGDWYDSTKICLDYLFDLIVPGGFLVIDDYGHWEGCRKAVNEFIMQRNITSYLHYIDSTGRYIQI